LLADAGIESPRVEADVLLSEVLRAPRYASYLDPGAVLAEDAWLRFVALVQRRTRREPIQYLIGRETFRGLDLVVTPDVLIPRPETEGAVAAVVDVMTALERPVIVDVGTGSGCLALAAAASRPDALVYAIDQSPAALGVARHNAERLGLSTRVRFLLGDLFAPLARLEIRVDVVVSNPPYVADHEYETLQPEVRFEPEAALRGGFDGLRFYRRIASEASTVLAPRGRVVLELGFGQAESVRAIAEREGFGVERLDVDANGIPRIMTLVGPN
jgi:release factor glutamine methyltransferase